MAVERDRSDRDEQRSAEEGTPQERTAEETFELGMRKRRAVLGDDHVDRAEASKTEFDADFQEFITRYAWGEVWQREGLDERTRHLVVLAMMAALGREEEFAMHVRASRNTGVSAGELKEALHLVAIYAGLPLANGAFKIARQVLSEGEEH